MPDNQTPQNKIPAPPCRIGCVSFLNSKPLIAALLDRPDIAVHFAVPSALLELVEAGTVSTALLSLVDYQQSMHDLLLVPAGAIGSDGTTLTVRIFSRVPPARITRLHGDTDSHTSVILGQLVLRELYRTAPTLLPLPEGPPAAEAARPEALLLIGDKVVTAAPPADRYPFQLDLGEQWKKLTGLPFIFALWMMRADAINRPLARRLHQARIQGAQMTEELLDRYATATGWPRDLARRYFQEYLRFDVTPAGRQAIERFFALAAQHGLLTIKRPLRYLELD